jgi:hypothetical protein
MSTPVVVMAFAPKVLASSAGATPPKRVFSVALIWAGGKGWGELPRSSWLHWRAAREPIARPSECQRESPVQLEDGTAVRRVFDVSNVGVENGEGVQRSGAGEQKRESPSSPTGSVACPVDSCSAHQAAGVVRAMGDSSTHLEARQLRSSPNTWGLGWLSHRGSCRAYTDVGGCSETRGPLGFAPPGGQVFLRSRTPGPSGLGGMMLDTIGFPLPVNPRCRLWHTILLAAPIVPIASSSGTPPDQ